MCTRKRQQCPLFNSAVFNTFFLSLGNLQCHICRDGLRSRAIVSIPTVYLIQRIKNWQLIRTAHQSTWHQPSAVSLLFSLCLSAAKKKKKLSPSAAKGAIAGATTTGGRRVLLPFSLLSFLFYFSFCFSFYLPFRSDWIVLFSDCVSFLSIKLDDLLKLDVFWLSACV